MVRKKKALLAEQGIIHLKHSFVQPSEESGLLKTVGGEEERTALILSTGTYGYAIPISTITKKNNVDGDNRDDNDNDSNSSLPEVVEIVEQTSDPDIKIVRQKPPENNKASSSKPSSSRSKKSSKSSSSSKSNDKSSKTKEINPDDLSVAELVRVIGGGSGAPLRRCDVVDDRKKPKTNGDGDGNEDVDTGEQVGRQEEDPEADEFYESLGIQRSKRRKMDDDEEEVSQEGPGPSSTRKIVQQRGDVGGAAENSNDSNKEDDPDVLKSIQNYYKDNADSLYYYSQQHNPYGDHRLEFRSYIDGENSSEYDQDYIMLAKLAQRARAAAQAAALRRMQESSKSKEAKDKEDVEAIYDPLPMEVVPSTKPEDLGITVDTNFEQFWEFVKEDPHDFDRWIYLIQYVENTNNLNTCRTVYSAFLPLFPYCFGYWKRYSELEKKSYYFGR